MLATLEHPFVIRMHSAFQTREHLYMALDYCAGGDLCYQCYKMFTKIDYFNDGQARFYISQIILAIEHRDPRYFYAQALATAAPRLPS